MKLFSILLLLFHTTSGFFNAITHKQIGVSSVLFVTRKYNNNKQYNNKQYNNKHNNKYPLSHRGYENYLRRLNSKNITEREYHMVGGDFFTQDDDEQDDDYSGIEEFLNSLNNTISNNNQNGEIRIILSNNEDFDPSIFNTDNKEDESEIYRKRRRNKFSGKTKKSENFEIIDKSPINFNDVGGYDNIKSELQQCVDLLKNHTKYRGYNIRVPKGLIFEGPPGNGKTLLAKALAGESGTSFIAVSGAEFQEKYVGVGSLKIRELFALAKDNIPCIIFIDEIDAVGRKRSGDGEQSSNERDSTLNELLVGMDGFKNSTGIFIIGATNRADLLDPALIRPGRIDKRIFIGNPDKKTRSAIINIHIIGKPHDSTVNIENLIDSTEAFSGAQIENLLNEAMLNALKENRGAFTSTDVEYIMNKIISGWMPTEHAYTEDMIDRICVHEMGHAIVGILSKSHQKITKVVLNLHSPHSPGFTAFQPSTSSLHTREEMFEHLMILLGGRIAEEVIYSLSVTSGAIQDFDSALKNANVMITQLGFGKHIIYPTISEKYKEIIDEEVFELIESAYQDVHFILKNCKPLILEGAMLLKKEKIVKSETLIELMNTKYQSIFDLTNENKNNKK